MASLAGALFDDYSSLNETEKNHAVACIGETVSFTHNVAAAEKVTGSKASEVFEIMSPSADIHDTGGTDIVITDSDYIMGAGLEHLLMTGGDNISAAGNTQDNVMAGNGGNNSLSGNEGDDCLLGGEGNDTLSGGSGQDTIDGGADGDFLTGGAGSDFLEGGEGDDTIIGDAGADTIVGGAGDDTLTGGAGGDVFYFGDGSGRDRVTDFDPARDVIHLAPDINGSGIASAEDVLARAAADGQGNTVIDLGNGHTLTLLGTDPNGLDTDMFVIQ